MNAIPDDWEVATGRYVQAWLAEVWHAIRETVEPAYMSPGAREYGGGIEVGYYVTVCGRNVTGFPEDQAIEPPFCKQCLRKLSEPDREMIESLLTMVAARARAAYRDPGLTFQRSSTGRRRHICDWLTGTALCAPETNLDARPETDDDNPRDPVCMICDEIGREFVRAVEFRLAFRSWRVEPAWPTRPAVRRLEIDAQDTMPGAFYPWLKALVDVVHVRGWSPEPPDPHDTWGTWSNPRED